MLQLSCVYQEHSTPSWWGEFCPHSGAVFLLEKCWINQMYKCYNICLFCLVQCNESLIMVLRLRKLQRF